MDQNQSLSVISENRIQKLESQIRMADSFINKNYLMNIGRNPVYPPLAAEEVDYNCVRIYRISKVTVDEAEDMNSKLISVYSAVQESCATLFLIIDSKEDGIAFYCGVKGETAERAREAGSILEKSLKGSFPGTLIAKEKAVPVMESVTGLNRKKTDPDHFEERHIEAVTVIPSDRNKEKQDKEFVQGLEKLIDTMAGDRYSVILMAEPVDKTQLEQMKRGYEELYSNLSSYAGQSLAYGENDSESVAEGMMENLAKSINNSVTNTIGTNRGENSSVSKGTSRGRNSPGMGMGRNTGSSQNTTSGYSSGESWSEAVVKGDSTSETTGTSTTSTKGTGTSKTLTINFENKSIKNLMEKIEQNLKRIADCEAFGLWRCAAYFISADGPENAIIAANCFRSLMCGEDTQTGATHMNLWSYEEGARKKDGDTRKVLQYLFALQHPLFKLDQSLYGTGFHGERIVSPTNLISGKELPIFMGLPNHSVAGLTVVHKARFGRSVYTDARNQERRKIRIGSILHMGVVEPTEVMLDLDSFTSHCFITGSTGSGKSNTTYKLLEQFYKNDVKFLVIEPAKGEYRKEFANVPGINIFCTNAAYFRMLKINPFRFPERIHVLEHLDRLVEIFNACWEMTAAMPAVLKDSIEQAYLRCGWDLQNSIFMKSGPIKYPTFQDVLDALPRVIEQSAYSDEVKGNYIGSLVTRVHSLTIGISGQIFNDETGLSDELLFDDNTIVDLSRVGSAETKALIMGTLILRLNEYRMASANVMNRGLKHVTVMEEAHNLLRRTDGQANPLLSKSVEMISNSIAEMRTYGEGFLIVDQSPGAVDISAIKNTNTKIIMHLPDHDDSTAVGKAVGLTDEQIDEISKLGTGEAIITQNNWLEAVMSKIDFYTNKSFKGQDEIVSHETMADLKGKILEVFFTQQREEKYSFYEIQELIMESGLNRHKASEYFDYWENIYRRLPLESLEFEEEIYTFLGCKLVFDICPVPLVDMDQEKAQKQAKVWLNSFLKLLQQYAHITDEYTRSEIVHYLMDYQMVQKKGNMKKLYDVLFE